MTHDSLQRIRKRAPQLIVVAIAIVIVAYVLISILEDTVIEGGPVTGGPVISAVISIMINVKDTVKSWGYFGIFMLMLLEASSVPIPSEVILPFAGFLASTGQLNIWITVLVATVAGVMGSLIDYYIGLKGVQSLARHRILGRALLSAAQLEIAANWFSRHGAIMVFFCRLIPGFRTLVSFPAGAVRMPLPKFIAYTTAGCLLWNTILIYLGLFLGNHWSEVAGISHYLILSAIVAAIIITSVYLIRRWKKMRIAKQMQQNAKLA